MKIRTKFFATIATCLTLTSCIIEPVGKGENDLQSGDVLPTFEVTTSTGEIVSRESLKGHDSMIVFFNTDCSDCRKELPVLQNFFKLYADSVKIICISREENEERVAQYWRDNKLTLPYSAQPDRKIYNLFASSSIPRIYIAAPNLIIRQIYTDNHFPTLEELQNVFSFAQ